MRFNRILPLLYRKFVQMFQAITVLPRSKKCFTLYVCDSFENINYVTSVLNFTGHIHTSKSLNKYINTGTNFTQHITADVDFTSNQGCDL